MRSGGEANFVVIQSFELALQPSHSCSTTPVLARCEPSTAPPSLTRQRRLWQNPVRASLLIRAAGWTTRGVKMITDSDDWATLVASAKGLMPATPDGKRAWKVLRERV